MRVTREVRVRGALVGVAVAAPLPDRADVFAQLVVARVSRVEWTEAAALATTDRQAGGFGHTGGHSGGQAGGQDGAGL